MSTKINVYNQKADLVQEMNVSDKIFGAKVSEALIHQAMVCQMSNARQVLAHTKDRSEVSGGGKKPWKQKGTGRARAGSSRSPIWIGGGVTFGPLKDRNFTKNINKKMKQGAIFMTLSDRLASGDLAIVEKFEIEEFKTKVFNELVESFLNKVFATNKKKSILLINDKKDDKVKYSGRNIKGVEIINIDNLNLLDLLKYKSIILTKDGVNKLEKIYK